MLQAFHKLHSKLKTIPELKSALQQIWDDLSQTTINKAIILGLMWLLIYVHVKTVFVNCCSRLTLLDVTAGSSS